jgi:hexokinase
LSERFLSAEPFALPDAEAAAMGRPSPLDALCRDDSDAAALRLIAGLSFDRAARLLCACLLAVVTAVGGDKNSPFRVALEGSTIVKSPLLRGKLERLTAEHIAGTTGKPLDFITGEHLTLTGSAAAALLCGL